MLEFVKISPATSVHSVDPAVQCGSMQYALKRRRRVNIMRGSFDKTTRLKREMLMCSNCVHLLPVPWSHLGTSTLFSPPLAFF